MQQVNKSAYWLGHFSDVTQARAELAAQKPEWLSNRMLCMDSEPSDVVYGEQHSAPLTPEVDALAECGDLYFFYLSAAGKDSLVVDSEQPLLYFTIDG